MINDGINDGSDDDGNDDGGNDVVGNDDGGYDDGGDNEDGDDDDDDPVHFACHLKISGVTFHVVCCSRPKRSQRARQVWAGAIMIPG